MPSSIVGARNGDDRPPAAGPRYSTAATPIGELLADRQAKAAFDRRLPGLSADRRLAMARFMTLRAVQVFALDRFGAAALDALDALDVELAGLAPPA